jgi:hypothetical protein
MKCWRVDGLFFGEQGADPGLDHVQHYYCNPLLLQSLN